LIQEEPSDQTPSSPAIKVETVNKDKVSSTISPIAEDVIQEIINLMTDIQKLKNQTENSAKTVKHHLLTFPTILTDFAVKARDEIAGIMKKISESPK
jgi:hypothetical protein